MIEGKSKGRKFRKFKEMWTVCDECQDIIKEAWNYDKSTPIDKFVNNSKKVLEELS